MGELGAYNARVSCFTGDGWSEMATGSFLFKAWLHTVRACNLSPNDPELGAPRFAGCAIDEGNLFAQIEARSGHQQEIKCSAG